MPSMSAPSYDLSPSDAAKLLHVHEDTVKRWAKDGALRAIKTPGGWWRFSQRDIDDFLAAHVHVPTDEAAS